MASRWTKLRLGAGTAVLTLATLGFVAWSSRGVEHSRPNDDARNHRRGASASAEGAGDRPREPGTVPDAAATRPPDDSPGSAVSGSSDTASLGTSASAPPGSLVVEGVVTDEWTRLVVPSLEVVARDDQKVGYVATTDDQGRFRVVLRDGSSAIDEFFVDSDHLLLMRWNGGESAYRSPRVAPAAGVVSRVGLGVRRVFWLTGTVVDEHGRPIGQARLTHPEPTQRLGSVDAYPRCWTGPGGAFRGLGPFLENPEPSWREDAPGSHGIAAAAPGFGFELIDPWSFRADGRDEIKVVLHRGYDLRGVLVDTLGHPLEDEEIALEYAGQPLQSRHLLTDGGGRWHLESLPPGPATVFVRAFAHDARLTLPIDVAADDADVRLVAQPIQLSKRPRITPVAGLGLTDVDEELRSAFELSRKARVLIYGISDKWTGSRVDRGTLIQAVQGQQVDSVREFVDRLAEATKTHGRIQITLLVPGRGSAGEPWTTTMNISPTPEQLAEITALRRRLHAPR